MYKQLYEIMQKLYDLTITSPLEELTYYNEEENGAKINYAQINGTESFSIEKRLKYHKALLENIISGKQYKKAKLNFISENGQLSLFELFMV